VNRGPLVVMSNRIVRLDPKWAPLLASSPEAGMGYWIVSLRLATGEAFDRVVVDSGYVVEVPGYAGIPFTGDQIVEITVTNDKSRYHRRPN
jgi:hypothetical protein